VAVRVAVMPSVCAQACGSLWYKFLLDINLWCQDAGHVSDLLYPAEWRSRARGDRQRRVRLGRRPASSHRAQARRSHRRHVVPLRGISTLATPDESRRAALPLSSEAGLDHRIGATIADVPVHRPGPRSADGAGPIWRGPAPGSSTATPGPEPQQEGRYQMHTRPEDIDLIEAHIKKAEDRSPRATPWSSPATTSGPATRPNWSCSSESARRSASRQCQDLVGHRPDRGPGRR